MTDFTREALLEKMARAFALEDNRRHILAASDSTQLGHANDRGWEEWIPMLYCAFDAILANARIVPLTVTDEMAQAFEECFSDSESWKLEIDAAIDAGKLK